MAISIDKRSSLTIFSICHFIWWFILVSFIYYPDFDHHINLSHVCTHLYWSFNPVNSTLSVYFKSSATSAVAPPHTAGNGSSWVAWGINPINSSGLSSIGTQLTQMTQVVVLSVDAQRSLMVERYNFSESETIWGDFVGFESSFDFGLMKFEAGIALPEKSETISQLLMIGGNGDGGKPNLQEADLKFFEVLNLRKAKQSTILRLVDGLSRAFSFQKGCTRERKTIWDEYLTLNNFEVACNYGIIMTIISLVEVKEDKLYWAYWKLFGLVGVFISLTIMYISLTSKANGVLKISGWSYFSPFYYALNTLCAALPTTIMSVAVHKILALSRERSRERRRELEEFHYSLITHYRTMRINEWLRSKFHTD